MMRCALLAALLAWGPVLAGPRAHVELQEAAPFPDGPLLLGHIARIHSGDLDLARRLVRFPVPLQDGTQEVDRVQLSAALARHLHVAGEDIAWAGAGSTRVARAASALDANAVVRTAMQALTNLLQGRGVTAEVRVRSQPRASSLASGNRLQARSLDHLPLRRNMVAWVDVLDGERVLRTVPVTFELAWQESGSSASPAAPSAAPEPARWTALAVARGEWATLRAHAGPVALESRVEVLQDGRPGDRIRVRQPGGGGMVFARVLGAGQVELVP